MLGYIVNGKLVTDEQGNEQLHYYGILANQKSFIWIQSKALLLTFVDQRNKHLVNGSLAEKIKEKAYHSKEGLPLDLYYFSNKENLDQFVSQSQKDRFASENKEVEFLESDVSPLYRFLMEYKVRGIVDFKSIATHSSNEVEIFTDPNFTGLELSKELKSTELVKQLPRLEVLSIDIETNAFPFEQIEQAQLYSIALVTENFSKVLMLADENKEEDNIEYYTNEKDLLIAFKNHLQNINPQVIVGWNIVDFDFRVLISKFLHYDIPLHLGINQLPLEYQKFQNNRLKVSIPGRVVLDGIPLVKIFASKKYHSYSLENISQELLQAGKIISEKGEEKVEKINQLFLHDKKKLAEYNLQDTILVLQIFKKLKLTEIQYYRSLLSGVFLEGLAFYNDIIDNLYLPHLHRFRLAIENQNTHKKTINFDINIEKVENQFLENVVQIQFIDLFASVIKTYNIDPVGIIWAMKDPENSINEEGLTPFHQKINILSKVYTEISVIENQIDSPQSHFKQEFQIAFTKALAEHKKNIQQILVEDKKNVYLSRYTTSPLLRSLVNYQKYIITHTSKYLKQIGLKVICSDLENIFYQKENNQNDTEQDVISIIKKHWQDYFQEKNLPFYLKLRLKNEYKNFYLPNQPIKYEHYHFLEFKALDIKEHWHENIKTKRSIPFLNTLIEKTIAVIFAKKDIKDFFHQIKEELLEGLYDLELVYQKRYTSKQQFSETKKRPDYILAAEDHYGIDNIPRIIKYFTSKEGVEIFREGEKNNFHYIYYLEKEIFPHMDKFLLDTEYHQHIKVFDPNDDGQMTFF